MRPGRASPTSGSSRCSRRPSGREPRSWRRRSRETLKRVDGKKQITATVDRESLWAAQTPQVFRRELLIEAYAKRGNDAATDDAQLVERLGHAVTVVPCSAMNLKITTRDDLKLAEQVLKVLPKPKPDGFNHPFAGDDLFR